CCVAALADYGGKALFHSGHVVSSRCGWRTRWSSGCAVISGASGVHSMRDSAVRCGVMLSNFSILGASSGFKKDVRGISRSALPSLVAYNWPGNVRELENIIERGVALATRPVLQMEDLPLDLALHEKGPVRGDRDTSSLPLREARERFEQAYVLRALEHEDWNQSRAARRLGVHRNTLLARLAAWGIRAGDR